MLTRPVAPPESLLAAARQARAQAYAPFSQFAVGAAVQAADGRIFVGVNVENPSYSLTVCAERSAVVAAATAGVRPPQLVAVAVVAQPDPITPCGACRQVLAHWCPPGADVWCFSVATGHCRLRRVGELLPDAFDWAPT